MRSVDSHFGPCDNWKEWVDEERARRKICQLFWEIEIKVGTLEEIGEMVRRLSQ